MLFICSQAYCVIMNTKRHLGDSTQEEMTFLTTLEVATLKPAGHNCSLAKMWPKPVCCISTWQLCSGNSYTALHKFQVCCHCPTQVGSSRAPGLICFKSIHFLGSVLKISTLAHYHLLGILKKNHCFQWPKVNITYALLIKAYLQNKLMPCTRGYKAYSV